MSGDCGRRSRCGLPRITPASQSLPSPRECRRVHVEGGERDSRRGRMAADGSRRAGRRCRAGTPPPPALRCRRPGGYSGAVCSLGRPVRVYRHCLSQRRTQLHVSCSPPPLYTSVFISPPHCHAAQPHGTRSPPAIWSGEPRGKRYEGGTRVEDRRPAPLPYLLHSTHPTLSRRLLCNPRHLHREGGE